MNAALPILSRPRRMKRCGRSVLLWSLALYAAAAVGLGAVVNRWCPEVAARLYRDKWAQLCRVAAESPRGSLVVMLGSSRTDRAFQAGLLDGRAGPDGRGLRAYNFGVRMAGPIHEYIYLQRMLRRGIRPRLLLVEYLPPLLNDGGSTRVISEENWTFPAWLSPADLARLSPYLARPGRKVRGWLEARLAPWYAHRAPLNNWLQAQLSPHARPRQAPWPHDRWGCRLPEALTASERTRRYQLTREYVSSLAHFRMGKGPARAMRDLLETCRRERIPVVLVLTPESTEFRSWYSPQCLAATLGLLEELRAAFGVEVVDARDWVPDEDFQDGHHLDERGARVFTTRLIAEVQRVLARDNPR